MAAAEVVEICAGAGGQALGLEKAGFEHALAVELDETACDTLRENRPGWKIAQGDVADPGLWNPADYQGVSLLAGGVPCPPFTIAGKQLGATDERDLFAWAVELVEIMKPRALLLENVRGLSMPRFAAYRQHVFDRLISLGYLPEWRLLQASDFSVPQLRPRFVLVALQPDDAPYFHWPEPDDPPQTVGETLVESIGADGWEGAEAWKHQASKIAPTIVGGSKKHGGADLGPTRAKRAWAEMGVDALGIADTPPRRGDRFAVGPKLTVEMVSQLQGWPPSSWTVTGRKTARYRQVGNAFPPPVAAAVGKKIQQAFARTAGHTDKTPLEHDPVYKALKDHGDFMTPSEIVQAIGCALDAPELERRISLLGRDFDIEIAYSGSVTAYRLGKFKAFLGQELHDRHELFLKNRAKIS